MHIFERLLLFVHTRHHHYSAVVVAYISDKACLAWCWLSYVFLKAKRRVTIMISQRIHARMLSIQSQRGISDACLSHAVIECPQMFMTCVRIFSHAHRWAVHARNTA